MVAKKKFGLDGMVDSAAVKAVEMAAEEAPKEYTLKSYYITPAMAQSVKVIANWEMKSANEVVRAALAEYIDRWNKIDHTRTTPGVLEY